MLRISSFFFLYFAFGCRDKNLVVNPDTGPESVDADGDGFFVDVDCDDYNASVHPEMNELCDALDNDCDGTVDEDVILSFYADRDGDGFGDPETEIQSCEQPNGYVTVATDCDDENPDVFSGAPEACNHIDDNCDGNIDEDLFSGLFYDGDGDGHGDVNLPSEDCSGGVGYVYYGDDCDDSNPNIYPFALELCDEIDNNCDGDIDEGKTTTFYRDLDEDGFGDEFSTIEACSLPNGYVQNHTDCDDADTLQFPGAAEFCNEEDDDCDGNTDENPVDSPTWYYDIDGDGFGSSFIVALECLAPPGYVGTNTDCDDTNIAVYPQATEICDNLDNDCNGSIDDNAIDAFHWYRDEDRDDYGNPNDTIYQCNQSYAYILNNTDCNDNDSSINPGAVEYCNGEDEDCDGVIDNGTIDAFVYYADTDGDGFGDSNNPIYECLLPPGYVQDDTDCDDADSSIYPNAPDPCDGIDQNCRGMTFYEQDLDGDGALACEASIWVRNGANNPTNPNNQTSQASSIISNMGVSITQQNLGNIIITPSFLENFGVYVHHGQNTIGSLGAYSNAEAYSISNWVYEGGRYLFIDYHVAEYPCEVIDSLPAAFGVTCSASATAWSGTTSSFYTHPITSGLIEIGGSGGQNWGVSSATVLASINGNEFVMASEYGEGKVVIVANEYPFLNSQSGYSIGYQDNQILVENIWNWLLE